MMKVNFSGIRASSRMTPQYISRKIADRVCSLPAYLAFWCTKIPPVFNAMEQRHARAIQHTAPVEGLRPIEAEIVTALERDGIFVTDLEALGLAGPEGREIMERARGLTDKLAGRMTAPSPCSRQPTAGRPEPGYGTSTARTAEWSRSRSI